MAGTTKDNRNKLKEAEKTVSTAIKKKVCEGGATHILGWCDAMLDWTLSAESCTKYDVAPEFKSRAMMRKILGATKELQDYLRFWEHPATFYTTARELSKLTEQIIPYSRDFNGKGDKQIINKVLNKIGDTLEFVLTSTNEFIEKTEKKRELNANS